MCAQKHNGGANASGKEKKVHTTREAEKILERFKSGAKISPAELKLLMQTLKTETESEDLCHRKALEASLESVLIKVGEALKGVELNLYEGKRFLDFFGLIARFLAVLMECGICASRLDVRKLTATSLGTSYFTGEVGLNVMINVRIHSKHGVTHSVSFILYGNPGKSENYSIERVSYWASYKGNKDPERYPPVWSGLMRALDTILAIEAALREIE